MSSRQSTLEKIANLVGNAAGHVVRYEGDFFSTKEAANYYGQASTLAKRHTWNENEVARMIENAVREATKFIDRRLPSHRHNELETMAAKAKVEVEQWAREEMPTKD
jgi:hypothetical protein